MNTTRYADPTTDRVQAKINHLQRLIDHPRTSDAERDAARRALVRVRQAHEPSQTQTTGPRFAYNPGAWHGSKYEQARTLSATEIAKLIREDLKLARKIGRAATTGASIAVPDPIADAPTQIKYSVRTRYGSCTAAIDITIGNVPQEWGWTDETDDYGNPVRIATAALAALVEEVKQIHNAYNYDNSDAMTDYFEKHYWGSVSIDYRLNISLRRR